MVGASGRRREVATSHVSVGLATGLAVVAFLGACTSLLGIQDGAPETAVDAGPDLATPEVQTLPEAGGDGDAGVDAGAPADGAAGDGDSGDGPRLDDAGCPTGRGPVMVLVNRSGARFCIDATEVTRGQYLAFLMAKAGDTSGQPPFCAWNNVTYAPSTSVDYGQATVPMSYVNWCDAYAFCTWAGKHLCGAVDGGPAPYYDGMNLANAYYFACSHGNDGLHAFPYGNIYDAGVCNGGDHVLPDGGMDLVPVASLPGCQVANVPYAGLYDQSGNVQEWVDTCQDQNEAGADADLVECNYQGGAFDTAGATNLSCDHMDNNPRWGAGYDVGFRCCYP